MPVMRSVLEIVADVPGLLWKMGCAPEGDSQGETGQQDDVQQQQGGGEEPVNVARVVNVAQVAVRVGCQGLASARRLPPRNRESTVNQATKHRRIEESTWIKELKNLFGYREDFVEEVLSLLEG